MPLLRLVPHGNGNLAQTWISYICWMDGKEIGASYVWILSGWQVWQASLWSHLVRCWRKLWKKVFTLPRIPTKDVAKCSSHCKPDAYVTYNNYSDLYYAAQRNISNFEWGAGCAFRSSSSDHVWSECPCTIDSCLCKYGPLPHWMPLHTHT